MSKMKRCCPFSADVFAISMEWNTALRFKSNPSQTFNKVDKVVEEGVLNMLSIVLGDIFPVFLAQISARSREVKDFSFITFSM